MSPKHGHFGAMWPPFTVTPDKSAMTDENFYSRNRFSKVPAERVSGVATGVKVGGGFELAPGRTVFVVGPHTGGAEAGGRQLVAAALRAPLGCERTRVAGREVDGGRC